MTAKKDPQQRKKPGPKPTGKGRYGVLSCRVSTEEKAAFEAMCKPGEKPSALLGELVRDVLARDAFDQRWHVHTAEELEELDGVGTPIDHDQLIPNEEDPIERRGRELNPLERDFRKYKWQEEGFSEDDLREPGEKPAPDTRDTIDSLEDLE